MPREKSTTEAASVAFNACRDRRAGQPQRSTSLGEAFEVMEILLDYFAETGLGIPSLICGDHRRIVYLTFVIRRHCSTPKVRGAPTLVRPGKFDWMVPGKRQGTDWELLPNPSSLNPWRFTPLLSAISVSIVRFKFPISSQFQMVKPICLPAPRPINCQPSDHLITR